MKLLKNGLLFALSAVVLTGISQRLQAQNVDAEMLLHPPADSWPGYQGDYTGQRHSKLTQITPDLEQGDHLDVRQFSGLLLILSSLLAIALSFFHPRLALWALVLNLAAPILRKWSQRRAAAR